jgi:hypothetical protein
MTTGSLRIGVGSGLGVLLGSIVLLGLVVFLGHFPRTFSSVVFFGRFFQGRLRRPFVPKVSELPLAPGRLESTAQCTQVIADWVQTGYSVRDASSMYFSRSPGRF